MGILPGHAPLLGLLGIGTLTYVSASDGKKRYLSIHGGFVEVLDDHVRVLADCAERAEEIDVQRARAALQRAQEEGLESGPRCGSRRCPARHGARAGASCHGGAAQVARPALGGGCHATPEQPVQHAVLIPAYRPSACLVDLVRELSGRGMPAILLVDDGSGPSFAPLSTRRRSSPACTCCGTPVNLGKGAALKTGINHALCAFPGLIGIVTADADGQHHPEDIERVAAGLRKHPEALVLGMPHASMPRCRCAAVSATF